jgi:hypothetical protein
MTDDEKLNELLIVADEWLAANPPSDHQTLVWFTLEASVDRPSEAICQTDDLYLVPQGALSGPPHIALVGLHAPQASAVLVSYLAAGATAPYTKNDGHQGLANVFSFDLDAAAADPERFFPVHGWMLARRGAPPIMLYRTLPVPPGPEREQLRAVPRPFGFYPASCDLLLLTGLVLGEQPSAQQAEVTLPSRHLLGTLWLNAILYTLQQLSLEGANAEQLTGHPDVVARLQARPDREAAEAITWEQLHAKVLAGHLRLLDAELAAWAGPGGMPLFVRDSAPGAQQLLERIRVTGGRELARTVETRWRKASWLLPDFGRSRAMN